MKRALITGITCQDVSYLAGFLLKKDYDVHALGYVAPISLRSGLELAYADFTKKSLKLRM